MTRLNSAYINNGIQYDDLWLRGWGGHGAAFFRSAGPPPGEKVLEISGYLHLTREPIAVECAIAAHTGRLAMGSALGKVYVCDRMGAVQGWKTMIDLSD